MPNRVSTARQGISIIYSFIFVWAAHILLGTQKRKELTKVKLHIDPNADLDDLIFEAGDGGPSDR